MSIFDKVKAKPASPDAIQTRLTEAERRVRDLESQYAVVALEWASGGSAEAAKRDRLEADLTAAKRDRDALSAALALAREAEAARDRENVAALRAKQVRAVTQHLAARSRAAVELTKAIGLAVTAFRDMVNASEKARAACPIGAAWPLGSMCSFAALDKLTKAELYRQGGDPNVGNARSFPGGDAGDISKKTNPTAIRSLVDALQETDAFVIGALKGQPVVMPATPPIAPAPVIGVQHPGLPKIEAPEVNPDDMLPGTRSAAEIQTSIPRQKLSVTE